MKTLQEYAKFTVDMWAGPVNPNAADQLPDLAVMSLGLGGEAGEVQEHIKKYIRDGHLDKDALTKELGDTIYYWTRLCVFFGLDPDHVIAANVEKLTDRKARGVTRGSGDNR